MSSTEWAHVDCELASRGVSLGRPLTWRAITTSTNDDAKRAAREGAPHGATWVTDEQTHGRGRQGRSWHARPGEALLMSVLARVACPASRVPPLALIAGLAVRDAVARYAPDVEVGIKWPNDVLAGAPGTPKKKLAGVLVEAMIAGNDVTGLIVGIGVNVHATSFAPDLAPRATSLALLGAHVSRAELLVDILVALDRDLELAALRGLAPALSRLREVDLLAGNVVRSDAGEGRAEGIDEDGRLVVHGAGGVMRWATGEVHLR